MARANEYDVGDLARLTATFTSTGAALANPTKVTFTVVSPSGSTTTETSTGSAVTRPTTGKYIYDVSVTEAGVWNYGVSSSGVIQAAADFWFRAKESRV